MVLCAAADAAVGELEEVAERSAGFVDDEGLLDTHFSLSELVLDDGVLASVLVAEEVSDEGGLARSKESDQQIYPALLQGRGGFEF